MIILQQIKKSIPYFYKSRGDVFFEHKKKMATVIEKIDVSAPVLVYERPRFTEPMFVKAKDAPLKAKKQETAVEEPSRSPSATPKSDNNNNPASPKQETLLRRLSSRARSLSSFLKESAEPTLKNRSRSFSTKISRRVSGLFRNASFSSASTTQRERPASKEELIVFVDEQ